jgi:hypothetical protein
MKYILIIWVCSFIQGNQCLAPVESTRTYDSWYECSVEAQKKAAVILRKMGYADVNKYKVGTKYYCKAVQTF